MKAIGLWVYCSFRRTTSTFRRRPTWSHPPSRASGRRPPGSLENPEVHENVPGHIIPILEREFDDFDNEAEKFLDGQTRRERVHRLPPEAGRLRPAPARRPDDPRQAAVRRHHARADGRLRRRRSSSTRRSTRATSRRARTSRSTTCRCATPPKLIRELSRRRPVLARGLRQHRAQRHRRPVGRRLRGRALRPHALRRRLRALLRAPPDDAADAAQGQDRVHRHRRRTARITGIHDIAFIAARARRRAAASRSASAAARRSCRASRRRSTTSSRPTTAST